MAKLLLNFYRFLFSRPLFYQLNTYIFKLSLRGLGVMNYENSSVSGEKYLIEKLLPKIVSKDVPIFFDIGANIGNYSKYLSKSFPNAIIHAFEPHPNNFQQLRDSNLPPNIIPHLLALGQHQATLPLFDRADARHGSSHATLYKDVITDIHKQNIRKYTVQVKTLESICDELNIQNIDFIKIDTEGNELAVLKGAKSIIEQRRVKCIQFEFNEMNVISRSFFSDFQKLLEEYTLYRLLPRGLIQLNYSPLTSELFAYQNILALPNGLNVSSLTTT